MFRHVIAPPKYVRRGDTLNMTISADVGDEKRDYKYTITFGNAMLRDMVVIKACITDLENRDYLWVEDINGKLYPAYGTPPMDDAGIRELLIKAKLNGEI